MISYEPLWKTLKKRGLSTYTLRDTMGFGGGTIQRLRKNMSVSTNTLDDLCRKLSCSLEDIVVYEDDALGADEGS